MRARRSTPRSTSLYFVTNLFTAQGYQPTIHRCAPPPAGRHACGAASVGPVAARARPVRMLHARAHEAARVRSPLPRLPDSVDSAPAPPQRDATCAGHQHVRTRRLACFADGLRVAPPVQAAADARGRARRPPCPRHLRHDRQARRRHHDTTVTRIRPSSRPRALPLGQAARSLCLCLRSGRGRPRAGCGPVGALLDPLTIKSGPVDSVLVIGTMQTMALPRRRRLSQRVHLITASCSPHSPV
jgi:hypothetical protein